MSLFQEIRNKKSIATLLHYVYFNLKKENNESADLLHNQSIQFQTDKNAVKVAFICDEMTWQDYHGICNGLFLHPLYWEKQLEMFQPDVLFCESAWSGIDAFHDVWRARIYKDKRLLFENRDILLKLLEHCKRKHIPTVFWNKEDPTFFRHKIYDFTETALCFDYIFTTAKECVPLYKMYGHKNVYLLPFGVSKAYYEHDSITREKNTAAFFGSWFGDQIKRCKALEILLDYVIDQGIKLDIYDRKSESKSKKFRFPDKYKCYIHSSVQYKDIPKICSRYEYAVNVNTVTDSETMFSRRLLQMASCGLKVISNPTIYLYSNNNFMDFQEINNNIVIIKGTIRYENTVEYQFNKVLHEIEKNGSVSRTGVSYAYQ